MNFINQFHLFLNQRTLISPVLCSRMFTWSKHLNNHRANSVFFVCYFSKSTRTSAVIISSRNSNQLKHDLHFLRTCGCSQAVNFFQGYLYLISWNTSIPYEAKCIDICFLSKSLEHFFNNRVMITMAQSLEILFVLSKNFINICLDFSNF